MAITFGERAPDQLQITKEAIHGALANFWSALPCIVESYNADAVTITVQPAIQIPIRTLEGDIELVDLPLLLDVPVMFLCAGGFTITHPIKKGDECFVVFSDRNIDNWWQQGGVQPPFDTRKHDLSDGFAFFRPQSQAKKIKDISTENLEIRTDNNLCKIQITPDGEFRFIGKKSVFDHPVEMLETLKVDGDTALKSKLDVDGSTSLKSKLDVAGKSTLTGGANISGTEFGTHTHPGVQSGNSSTMPPTLG